MQRRGACSRPGESAHWTRSQNAWWNHARCTVHPIQVGLRILVEEFRTRVRENIEADPLRAVAIAYEEELTRIKEQLGEGGDLEEFTALCPTLSPMEPRYLVIFAMFMTMTICSWRSCCIPPTPPTQIEINLVVLTPPLATPSLLSFSPPTTRISVSFEYF